MKNSSRTSPSCLTFAKRHFSNLFGNILRLSALLLAIAPTNAISQTSEHPIIILNEGNFNRANASLSVWRYPSSEIRNGAFSAVNGLALGDVAQSAIMTSEHLFVVVNNSDVIHVLDAQSLALRAQIAFPIGSSPRELAPLRLESVVQDWTPSEPALGAVTHLFDGSVSLVDLTANTPLSPRIKVGLNPDKIVSHRGRWFVANWGFGADSTIMVLSASQGDAGEPESYFVSDTLVAGRGPREMVIDAEERLWVVCEGYTAYDESFNVIEEESRPGGLYGFDLRTGQQIHRLELPATGEDLLYDSGANKLYFLSEGVRVFDLTTLELSQEPLIQGSYYALGAGPSGEILLSDAGDYVSAGDVFLYSAQGSLLASARAGIIPGHFVRPPSQSITTAVVHPGSGDETPGRLTLGEAYPNPFNPQTALPVWHGSGTGLVIRVYDMTGRVMQTIRSEGFGGGWQTVRLGSGDWPSGIYTVMVDDGGEVRSTRITLIR